MRIKTLFFSFIIFTALFSGCEDGIPHDIVGKIVPVQDDFYSGLLNQYELEFEHDYGYATDPIITNSNDYTLVSQVLPEGVTPLAKEINNKIINTLSFATPGVYTIELLVDLSFKKITINQTLTVIKKPLTYLITGNNDPTFDVKTASYYYEEAIKKGFDFTWVSSDPTIFTAVTNDDKSCTITALKLGTATLSPVVDTENYDIADSREIEVTPGTMPIVTTIAFTQADNPGLSGDIVGIVGEDTITFNISAADYAVAGPHNLSTTTTMTPIIGDPITTNNFPAAIEFSTFSNTSYKVSRVMFSETVDTVYNIEFVIQ